VGVLVRSDNLASLTPAGRRAMIDYGVTTVIDLRAESGLKGSPGPPFSDFQSTSPVGPSFADGGDAGPTYLNLPLVDDKTAGVLNEARTMPERYMLILDRRQAALGTIFNAIAKAEGPVLFHCFAGKDRTGLVAALILSLAGVEPEAIGADYAETDAQLATRYAEWLSRAAPERLEGMRDELRCPPEGILRPLAQVEGMDAFRLEQVVRNIVSNALKYGARRPVEVSVGHQESEAVLAVKDQGIGIAPGELQRIFGPFERAVPSREISGLGLGLYIARQIVEAHGGSIAVESAPGRGSTFTVRLPPRAPELEPAPRDRPQWIESA